MEQSQKFTFARKKYYFVAGLPNRFVPNSVLLLEPRICYPALRITLMKKLFKIHRSYREFAIKIDKFLKKYEFFIFLIFFPKFLGNFTPPFALAITYRPEMSIAQIKALDEISPEMK